MFTPDQRRLNALTDVGSIRTDHWQYRFAAVTDVGQHRSTNEDYFLLHPDRHLYVIADGMGGHVAGDVASRIAGQTVASYFDEIGMPHHPDPTGQEDEALTHHLARAAKIANSTIFDEAQEAPDKEGMGTTLVTLAFCDDIAAWGHVGDSRLLRYRNGRLEQLTRDHSLLEQTIEREGLSGSEADELAENFPYKNILTRALGSQYVVDVDVDSAPVEDGDLFAMTTDGVHDVIGNDGLHRIIADGDDLHSLCRSVVGECNQRGGPDNITALFVQVRDRTGSTADKEG